MTEPKFAMVVSDVFVINNRTLFVGEAVTEKPTSFGFDVCLHFRDQVFGPFQINREMPLRKTGGQEMVVSTAFVFPDLDGFADGKTLLVECSEGFDSWD
jgi:hypothetical protein